MKFMFETLKLNKLEYRNASYVPKWLWCWIQYDGRIFGCSHVGYGKQSSQGSVSSEEVVVGCWPTKVWEKTKSNISLLFYNAKENKKIRVSISYKYK